MRVPSAKSLLFSFLALGFLFEIQDTVPGSPVYTNPTFVAPKISKNLSCQSLIDTLCSQLSTHENEGPLSIWMGREKFSLHFPADVSQSVQKAQISALRSGQAPADFIKNLERSYLVKMEAITNRSPASVNSDPEVARLKEKYQQALERTVNERLRAHPELTAEKIREDLQITLRRSLWEQNENFLRAKNEFNEVKSAYITFFAGKDEMLQKIRAIEFKVPDEILGEMTSTCANSPWETFYQAEKSYMSVCAGMLTSGQSLVYSFDKKFSQMTNTASLFTQILEKRYSGNAQKRVQLRRNFVLANAAVACKEPGLKDSFFSLELQKSLRCQ